MNPHSAYSGPAIVPDSFKNLNQTEQLEKKINYLKERLNILNLKLNEQLSKNKKLRLEIDKLRKERVVYDKIYRNQEHEIMYAKQEFIKCIERQVKAKDQRDVTLE